MCVKDLRHVFSSKNNKNSEDNVNLQDVRRLLTSTKSTREFAKTMRWDEMPNSLSTAPLLDALEFQEMIFATKSTTKNSNELKKNVPPVPPPASPTSSSHDAMVALQRRNNELQRTNAELLRELASAPTVKNMNLRHKKLEDELRNEIQTLRETHRSDLRRERERGKSSAENMRDQVEALTKENRELMQTRVAPDALRFQALERRLLDMETSYRERESQLELVLSAARRDGRLGVAETKRKYEAELKRKDEQIETFRKELNGMMRALKSLKKSRRG